MDTLPIELAGPGYSYTLFYSQMEDHIILQSKSRIQLIILQLLSQAESKVKFSNFKDRVSYPHYGGRL